MSVETAIYDVLAGAIDAAQAGDPLFEAELHQTLYERITKPFGIRVGDASFDLSPGPGGAVEEFDVLVMVQVFARAQDDALESARLKVRDIIAAVAQIFFDDPTLDAAVNDCRVLGGQGGWANLQTVRHAVGQLHVIVNETGYVSG